MKKLISLIERKNFDFEFCGITEKELRSIGLIEQFRYFEYVNNNSYFYRDEYNN